MTNVASPPTADQTIERTDGIVRVATGRVTSVLLELAIEMDLFSKLKDGPISLEDLPAVWGMPKSSTRLIAQALANLRLIKHENGNLSLCPDTLHYLVEDKASLENIKKFFRFNLTTDQLKGALLHPLPHVWYQLRDDGEVKHKQMLGQHADGYLNHWRGGLHEDRVFWGQDLAEQYDFSTHEVLLDLGGASGGVCLGIRKRQPHLRCIVFDIPEAAEVARQKIAEASEEDHVVAIGGSVFSDDLPSGADVVLMSQFLQIWSQDDARIILDKVLDLLPPGGVVLVKEPFFEDDWTGLMNPLLIAFILHGQDGKGGSQASYSEMERTLKETGFVKVRRGPNIVIGEKPE